MYSVGAKGFVDEWSVFWLQYHERPVYDDFTFVLKIHRNSVSDDRLYLSLPPIRLRRMCHDLSGFQELVHPRFPLYSFRRPQWLKICLP